MVRVDHHFPHWSTGSLNIAQALSRRGLLRAGAAAGLAAGATVALPAAPALAKSKASVRALRWRGGLCLLLPKKNMKEMMRF